LEGHSDGVWAPRLSGAPSVNDYYIWLQLGLLICKLVRSPIRRLMRYSLHEVDNHHVVATTLAADRDEALEWFGEKLRVMLTFEGDPVAADYALDEWPEGLLAHTANPTIPVL
jgi:hypothetical protein